MRNLYKVGDRVVRIKGALTGSTGTIVSVKGFVSLDREYTVGIKFDNPTIWNDRAYNGHASYCTFVDGHVDLQEDKESIEV